MTNELLYRTRGLTLAQKIDQLCEVDDDGHTRWLGTFGTSGSPVVNDGKDEMPASHTIYLSRRGRVPVGIVKADCDVRSCLTASHLMDELDRRKVRLQLRALNGLVGPWDTCDKGHDWETNGRVQPSLKMYCKACNTERSMRTRKIRNARKETP